PRPRWRLSADARRAEVPPVSRDAVLEPPVDHQRRAHRPAGGHLGGGRRDGSGGGRWARLAAQDPGDRQEAGGGDSGAPAGLARTTMLHRPFSLTGWGKRGACSRVSCLGSVEPGLPFLVTPSGIEPEMIRAKSLASFARSATEGTHRAFGISHRRSAS